MIRILHVVGTMDLGGAETFIMNLYRNIDREKIQFDFLCHNRIEAKYTDEIKSLGGKMYMVEGISHVGLFKYEKSLYTFFKSHPEYQIVHAHQSDMNGPILKQAAKAGVKKRISHSHTANNHKNPLKKAVSNVFKYYVNKYTTDAFACSDLAGQWLYSGDLLNSFKMINNGIDTKKFTFDIREREKIRKELSLGEGPVLGHVGRFAPVKNHTFIINVFAEFLKSHPNAKLVLIGQGERLTNIKEKVVELNLDKSVLFLGSRTDVNSLMCAMDVFIFPSLHEGLPVSVIEAQCSGLQVITSDTISEDTVITDLIIRASLENKAEVWSQQIDEIYSKSKSVNREKYPAVVKGAGFDADLTAKSLVDMYTSEE